MTAQEYLKILEEEGEDAAIQQLATPTAPTAEEEPVSSFSINDASNVISLQEPVAEEPEEQPIDIPLPPEGVNISKYLVDAGYAVPADTVRARMEPVQDDDLGVLETLGRGFDVGLDGVKIGYWGTRALLEEDPVAREDFMANLDQIKAKQAAEGYDLPVMEFTEIGNRRGVLPDSVDWAVANVGMMAPFVGSTMAGALAGGKAGGATGGLIAGPKGAALGTMAGSVIGSFSVGWGLQAGGLYSDLIDMGASPAVAKKTALNYGAAAALADIVPEAAFASAVLGTFGKNYVRSRLKNSLVGMGIGAPGEGVSEAASEAFMIMGEEVATGRELDPEVKRTRLMNATAAGALMGVGIGAAGGAMQPRASVDEVLDNFLTQMDAVERRGAGVLLKEDLVNNFETRDDLTPQQQQVLKYLKQQKDDPATKNRQLDRGIREIQQLAIQSKKRTPEENFARYNELIVKPDRTVAEDSEIAVLQVNQPELLRRKIEERSQEDQRMEMLRALAPNTYAALDRKQQFTALGEGWSEPVDVEGLALRQNRSGTWAVFNPPATVQGSRVRTPIGDAITVFDDSLVTASGAPLIQRAQEALAQRRSVQQSPQPAVVAQAPAAVTQAPAVAVEAPVTQTPTASPVAEVGQPATVAQTPATVTQAPAAESPTTQTPTASPVAEVGQPATPPQDGPDVGAVSTSQTATPIESPPPAATVQGELDLATGTTEQGAGTTEQATVAPITTERPTFLEPELIDPLVMPEGEATVETDQRNAESTNTFIEGLDPGEYNVINDDGEVGYVARVTQSDVGQKRVSLYDSATYEPGKETGFIGDQKALSSELNFGRVTTPDGEVRYTRSRLQPRDAAPTTQPAPATPRRGPLLRSNTVTLNDNLIRGAATRNKVPAVQNIYDKGDGVEEVVNTAPWTGNLFTTVRQMNLGLDVVVPEGAKIPEGVRVEPRTIATGETANVVVETPYENNTYTRGERPTDFSINGQTAALGEFESIYRASPSRAVRSARARAGAKGRNQPGTLSPEETAARIAALDETDQSIYGDFSERALNFIMRRGGLSDEEKDLARGLAQERITQSFANRPAPAPLPAASVPLARRFNETLLGVFEGNQNKAKPPKPDLARDLKAATGNLTTQLVNEGMAEPEARAAVEPLATRYQSYGESPIGIAMAAVKESQRRTARERDNAAAAEADVAAGTVGERANQEIEVAPQLKQDADTRKSQLTQEDSEILQAFLEGDTLTEAEQTRLEVVQDFFLGNAPYDQTTQTTDSGGARATDGGSGQLGVPGQISRPTQSVAAGIPEADRGVGSFGLRGPDAGGSGTVPATAVQQDGGRGVSVPSRGRADGQRAVSARKFFVQRFARLTEAFVDSLPQAELQRAYDALVSVLSAEGAVGGRRIISSSGATQGDLATLPAEQLLRNVVQEARAMRQAARRTENARELFRQLVTNRAFSDTKTFIDTLAGDATLPADIRLRAKAFADLGKRGLDWNNVPVQIGIFRDQDNNRTSWAGVLGQDRNGGLSIAINLDVFHDRGSALQTFLHEAQHVVVKEKIAAFFGRNNRLKLNATETAAIKRLQTIWQRAVAKAAKARGLQVPAKATDADYAALGEALYDLTDPTRSDADRRLAGLRNLDEFTNEVIGSPEFGGLMAELGFGSPDKQGKRSPLKALAEAWNALIEVVTGKKTDRNSPLGRAIADSWSLTFGTDATGAVTSGYRVPDIQPTTLSREITRMREIGEFVETQLAERGLAGTTAERTALTNEFLTDELMAEDAAADVDTLPDPETMSRAISSNESQPALSNQGATNDRRNEPALQTSAEGMGSQGRGDQVQRQTLRPNAEPNPLVQDGVSAYNARYGLGEVVRGHYAPVSEQRARQIAAAYDALPVLDPGAATQEAYGQLAAEIQQQWDYAINDMGITFEPWTQEGQPYANSREMVRDVRDNRHLWFFTGGEPHPLLNQPDADGLTMNDKLRAIHDLFGHAAEDYQFGARGEENAWIKHSQMFTPLAQRALTTETRGQNSWVNYGTHNYGPDGARIKIPASERPFATQKVALLPEEYMDWQGALAQSPTESRALAVRDEAVLPGSIAAAIREAGGITVDIWTGAEPDSGYIVAPFKETETQISLNAFGPKDVEDFIDRFRDLLAVRGMHLGGWLSGPTVYLDASIVTNDQVLATLIAQDGNQLAVFDRSNFTELSTADLGRRFSQALGRSRQGTEYQALARALRETRDRILGGLQETGRPDVPGQGALQERTGLANENLRESRAVSASPNLVYQDSEGELRGRPREATGQGYLRSTLLRLEESANQGRDLGAGESFRFRADTSGQTDRGLEQRRRAQAAAAFEELINVLEEQGLILDPDTFESTVIEGRDKIGDGSEHQVHSDKPTNRVIKYTNPDVTGSGVVGQSLNVFDYLRNLAAQNEILNDDIRLEGIVNLGERFPRVVISQTFVKGRDSTQKEIDSYFTNKGFEKQEDGSWIRVRDGQIQRVWDAVPGNLKTVKVGKKSTVVPFDVQISVEPILAESRAVRDPDEETLAAGEALNNGRPVSEFGLPRPEPVPEITPEGELDIADAKIDSTLRSLLKFGLGAIESATDKLRRGVGLEGLANAVERYYDRYEERMGLANGLLRRARMKMGLRGEKPAMETFERYFRERENGRRQQADEIYNNASESDRALIDAWVEYAKQTGVINTQLRTPNGKPMQVYDSKLKKWRPIRTVQEYFPRVLRPEVQAVLRNPAVDPALYSDLLDSLVAEGRLKTREDAATYLKKDYFSTDTTQDYFAGVERGRNEPLPELFYDYSFNAAARYMRNWAQRTSQIEYFGQATSPGSGDWFETNIPKVRDDGTRRYLTQIRDRVYQVGENDVFGTLMNWLNVSATGLQLGNPATAFLNLFGGSGLNVTAFGWKNTIKAAKDVLADWNNVMQSGSDIGIVGKDLLNILNDADMEGSKYFGENSTISQALSRFTTFTLKWGGYSGTENFIRASGMLAARAKLMDSIAANNKNPSSSKARWVYDFAKRENLDAEKLILENGQGEETSRFLRKAVNVPQGSYRIDMTPIYVDVPLGRFLFKYQKFGTQLTRMFWKHHLQPFIEKPDVANFSKLLHFFGAALGAGTIIATGRAALFGYPDPGPDEEDFKKALENPETAKMWGFIFSRAWHSMNAAGALGFFGNYFQFALDWRDQQRVKNPLQPPGLASIDAVVEVLSRLLEQGRLTGRDLDEIAQNTVALYRANRRIGLSTLDAVGLEWNATREWAAEKQVRHIRKYTRWYTEENEIEAKRAVSQGRVAKTPMSPTNREITQALRRGDYAAAKITMDRALAEAPKEERNAMKASIQSSVRLRQPVTIAGSPPSSEQRQDFFRWAKQNMPKHRFESMRREDENYRRGAARLGINIR